MNTEIESEEEYLKELLAKLNLVGQAVQNWQKLAEVVQQPKRWIKNPKKLHEEIRNHLIFMIGHSLIVMHELSKHPNFKNLRKEVLDKIYDYL